MATDTIKLPQGFVLDKPIEPNLPAGFVLDQAFSPEEEQRRITNQQQIRQEERANQLFEQLRGRLPTKELILRGPRPSGDIFAAKRLLDERKRRQAFQELTRIGFTPEQIRLSLQTQNIIGGPRIGRTVGGIGGAIAATALAGRLIPGPIDDAGIMIALIAAGGAGTAGIAGEAIQTGIEEKRLIGKREALKAFAIEAGTEIAGRGLVRAGKFLFSPLIKKTVPEAAALVDDFAKAGGSFSPSELDSRFSLQIEEAFSRGSFGAKQIWQEFEKRQGRAVSAFADNIIDNIGVGIARQTPEEIGEIFAEGITRPNGRIFNLLDDLFTPLYGQVDDLSRGINVSTKSLKAFANKHLATDTRLNKQFLSPIGRSKLQKILGMSDNVSFSDMRTLRSSFLRDVRKLARDVDQSQNIIKQLAGVTDEAVFDPKAAQGLTPEGLNLLRNTNSLYKTAQQGIKETFSESLAKRLLKNPSRVVKELFPNNNPKAIKILRQSLVEPISGRPSAEGKILWNQLRQAWLADAVDQSIKEGITKPNVFNNLIRKLGNKGLREMFPEKELVGNVERIQTLFDIAGKTPPSGTSLFSRGIQLGGVYKMYDSGKEGDFIGFTVGATLAIGPFAFAKLAINPKGVKFLTAGLKMKPGASGLVPNAVRMIRLLRDINKREHKAALQRETRRRFRKIPTPARELRGFRGRGF